MIDKRPVAVICVFFIIGILLGRFLQDHFSLIQVFYVFLIFVVSTLTLTLSHKWERGVHIFLFLSIISLGSLLYLNSNIFPLNHISRFLGKDKVKVEIIGIIRSPAETRGVYYGRVSSRYVFELEAISNLSDFGSRPTATSEVSGLALIRIQTEKDYLYGDRLLVKGAIKRPGNVAAKFTLSSGRASSAATASERNFNYRKYLENQNIFAIINASEKNVTLLSHSYKSNPVLRYAYLVREKIKNQFLEKMPLESGAFLRAILLGDRSELPKKLNESFRNSGTMHILPTQCREKHNYPS